MRHVRNSSFSHLKIEKSDSTVVVPGKAEAMPPQNICCCRCHWDDHLCRFEFMEFLEFGILVLVGFENAMENFASMYFA